MLQRVLDLVAQGEAATQRDLARTLEVPEPLLAQMIGQLVSGGYMAEAASCNAGCEGCALKPACGTDRQLRVWTLTEKGRRAVDRGCEV